MLRFEDVEKDVDSICSDLMKLIDTPGPTQSVARISEHDVRTTKQFPMTVAVNQIVERINREHETNIFVFEDHGNLILVGGINHKPSRNEVWNMPTTIGAHLDEIAYLISGKRDDGSTILLPLCSAPIRTDNNKGHPFTHEESRILGYRNGELLTIGYGRFHAKPRVNVEQGKHIMTGWNYMLKVDKVLDGEEVRTGDIAIQDYGTGKASGHFNLTTKITAKALDDRVGSTIAIHAIRYLSKLDPPTPVKAVLSGDEEGFPLDVSWARFIRPTFRKYCRPDGVTIICDGINGFDLSELVSKSKGELVESALLVPYTSHGKGAGDYGLFSLFRDKVIPYARKNGFEVETTTDYVSRSYDPKIMDEFPLITFLDWSAGEVGDIYARCHMHEEIRVKQIVNLVGTMVHAVKLLNY